VACVHSQRSGDFLEAYADELSLNIQTSTELVSASFDESTSSWTAVVKNEGVESEIHSTHLVMAPGLSGFPYTPEFTGQDGSHPGITLIWVLQRWSSMVRSKYVWCECSTSQHVDAYGTAGIVVMGGNLAQARYFSSLLTLQFQIAHSRLSYE